MKQEILEKLTTKYKNLGVGKAAFDGVADLLEKTVKEKEGIDAAVEAAEGILKAYQSDADKLRTKVAELEGKLKDKPKEKEDKKDEDTTLEDRIKKLEEREAELAKKDGFISLKSEAVKALTKKGIDSELLEDYLSSISYSEDLTKETIIEKVEAKHNFYLTKMTSGAGAPPRGEFGSGGKAQVKSFVEQKKAELEAAKERNKEVV